MVATVEDVTEGKRAEDVLQFMQFSVYNAVDPIVWVGQDGRLLEVNSAFCRSVGYSREELLSMRVHDLDPNHPAEIWPEFWERLKQAGTLTFESRHRTKEGRIFPVEITSNFFVYKGGEYHCSFVRDITERKQTEKKVKEEKDRAEAYLNVVGTIIVAIDIDQKVRLINQRGCRVLGYRQEEILGKNWIENFLPSGIRDKVRADVERFISGEDESLEYYENPVLTKSGEERIILWHSTVLRDEEGKMIANLSSGEDITERKRAEEELKESKEKYKELADQLPQTVFEMDEKGHLIFINQVGFDRFGYTLEDFEAGLSGFQMVIPEDRERAKEIIEETLCGKRYGMGTEFTALTKEGTTFPCIIFANPILRNDQVAGLRGFVVDITERVQVENEILAQRNLGLALSATTSLDEALRVCLETAMNVSGMDCGGVYSIDEESGALDLKFQAGLSEEFVNAVLRYDRDSINARLVIEGAKPVYSHYPKLNVPMNDVKLREGLLSLAVIPVCYEKRVIACLNIASHEFVEVPASARNALEAIAAQVSSAIARIKAEEEQERLFEQVRASHGLSQSLSRRLVEVQEAERRDLVRRLHDEVGQTLTALSLNLNIIWSQLPAETATKIATRMDDSLKLVEETIEHIRDVMSELRPPVLDDYGLTAVLHWYAKQFSERTGITLAVHLEELSPRLPLQTETALFRIAQEALTNVCKYAQAKHVTLELEEIDGEVRLIIADDGVGFDPTAFRPEARPEWGLINMRERAQAIGGQLRMETSPGKGTSIIVEVPRSHQL